MVVGYLKILSFNRGLLGKQKSGGEMNSGVNPSSTGGPRVGNEISDESEDNEDFENSSDTHSSEEEEISWINWYINLKGNIHNARIFAEALK